MSSYFEEHNCEELRDGERPNHQLDLARLLIDTGLGIEFQLEFERIFGSVDGRKQPPASKDFILKLSPTMRWNQDEKCSICLKEFQTDSPVELPCRHQFCSSCITRWLQLINTCPICRREYPTDDRDYESYKQHKQRQEQRKLELEDLHSSMFS